MGLSNFEKRIEKLEKDLNKFNQSLESHIDSHIIEDLRKREKDPSTSHCVPFRHTKYVYKYSVEEIAYRWNVTEDYVIQLAKEHGLERF